VTYFRGDLTLRIMWSIAINIMLFIITIALAMVDTSSWPYGFFYVTMISVVILNSKFLLFYLNIIWI